MRHSPDMSESEKCACDLMLQSCKHQQEDILGRNVCLRFDDAKSAHRGFVLTIILSVMQAGRKVEAHPSSVCAGESRFEQLFLAFFEMVKSSKVFVRDCS